MKNSGDKDEGETCREKRGTEILMLRVGMYSKRRKGSVVDMLTIKSLQTDLTHQSTKFGSNCLF